MAGCRCRALVDADGDAGRRRHCRAAEKVVKLITGRGNHSANGEAKILPAVAAYLEQRGFSFKMGLGVVEVYMAAPSALEVPAKSA